MEKGLESKPRVVYEVEKVIGVSSDGNVRTYQVQWAPSWVSSFHLAGCEHLIQEFLQRQTGNTLQCQTGEVNDSAANVHPASVHSSETLSESSMHARLESENCDRNSCTEAVSSHSQKINDCSTGEASATRSLQRNTRETIAKLFNPTQHVAESQNDYEVAEPDENARYMTEDDCDTGYEAEDVCDTVTIIKIEEDEEEENATVETTEVAGVHNPRRTFTIKHKPAVSITEMDDSSSSQDPSITWFKNHNSSDAGVTMAQIPTYDDPSYWHGVSDKFPNLPDRASMKDSKRKDHICPLCNKQFISRSHLNVHSRTHSGVKPYPCGHCDRAFIQSSDLKRHLLTHTGERPFVCDVCGKTFTRNNNLKHHLLTHQGFQ